MKINKIKLLISSILIILPSLLSLLFYEDINAQIAIHWGVDDAPDGFASPLQFAIIVPVCMLAVHLLCFLLTVKTNSRKDQNAKAVEVVYWIIPVINLYANIMVVGSSLGYEINVTFFISLLFGILFMVIGNYMPKTKQNSTMGIKLYWTLRNEENWNATHRFAGKLWFFGGTAFIVTALLPSFALFILMIAITALMVLLPVIYSYLFYKKQLREGKATAEDYKKVPSTYPRSVKIIAAVFVALILCGCAVLMFSGEIEIECLDDSVKISSTYYNDSVIKYSDISSVRLCKEGTEGERVMGFASAKLLLGRFRSDALGNYLRYTYTTCKETIELGVGKSTVVINCADSKSTEALYNELLEKTQAADKE